MDKVVLKGTGLNVSRIALGTADYGTKYVEEEAFWQMDAYADGGGNFIDTAYVYGSWVPGMGNISEKVIGKWMKLRGNRNQIMISTKGAHPDLENMLHSRVYPKEIEKDILSSLQGLQTDIIDIYFLHRDNRDVPVVELLACLEEQVKVGNIRYYGCSNWKLDRIKEAQKVAKEEGMKGFVCNQLMYSLATVEETKLWDSTLVMMNKATYDNHLTEDWNVMGYMAMAKGYLVKKLSGITLEKPMEEAYGTAANEKIITYLRELEQEGYAPDEVCLSYLMHQKLLTVPVVSFRTEEQLQSILRSCEMDLSEDVMRKLEKLRS